MVDLSAYHRELGVPLTRLHDVVWVNYDAVDISTIFRDFRNDPAMPESYEFAATDDYIAAVVKTGSSVLYRLGESIEHTPRKYRVHPPKDFGKWADICCAIIRHYNEGWVMCFTTDQFWEVWDEPENQPARDWHRRPILPIVRGHRQGHQSPLAGLESGRSFTGLHRENSRTASSKQAISFCVSSVTAGITRCPWISFPGTATPATLPITPAAPGPCDRCSTSMDS